MRYADEDNNVFRVTADGTVILKLQSEKRERNIGTLKDGKYTKPVKPDNIFHTLNKVGFNEQVMRELNPSYIAINFRGKHYIITSEIFWAEKTYLHFKGQGFELQCFIGVDVFEDRGTWKKITHP